MSLRSKVVLIVGGGRNPGAGKVESTVFTNRVVSAHGQAERARELVTDGASLALHYSSEKSKYQTVHFRDQIKKAYPGTKVSVHAGDLGSAPAVERLFAEVISAHEKIDIVVNTAGMVLKKPITNVSEAEYDKMFAYAVFVDDQRRRCVDQFNAEAIRG